MSHNNSQNKFFFLAIRRIILTLKKTITTQTIKEKKTFVTRKTKHKTKIKKPNAHQETNKQAKQ